MDARIVAEDGTNGCWVRSPVLTVRRWDRRVPDGRGRQKLAVEVVGGSQEHGGGLDVEHWPHNLVAVDVETGAGGRRVVRAAYDDATIVDRAVEGHRWIPPRGHEVRHLIPLAERVTGLRRMIPLVDELRAFEVGQTGQAGITLRTPADEESAIGHPALSRAEQFALPSRHREQGIVEPVLRRRLPRPVVRVVSRPIRIDDGPGLVCAHPVDGEIPVPHEHLASVHSGGDETNVHGVHALAWKMLPLICGRVVLRDPETRLADRVRSWMHRLWRR